jgi:hypothetical protein
MIKKRGSLMYITPACARYREGSDHFRSYVYSLSLHLCKGNISGAHGAHIKYDPSILDPTLLERLGDRGYLQKFQTMVEEVFFISYVNSVESNIDGSDLICAPCASRCHVDLICSLVQKAISRT